MIVLLVEGIIRKKNTMKRNIKRRKSSLRLKGWDYRSKGFYFITICTANRYQHFGAIENGMMRFSIAGVIVQGFWYDIPKHFSHVSLGEFVVMPNHIHGIIKIDQPLSTVGELRCNAPTVESEYFAKISPKAGSISTIIRSYKSVCTKYIRKACPKMNFAWQSSFHDAIVRDAKAYQVISDYIKSNPEKWEADRFNFE